MTDRQGVEIDYCPKCRGVWLDKGELDKIIERTADYEPPVPDKSYYKEQKYQQPSHHHTDPRYHKKKKGFFGEMFDFD